VVAADGTIYQALLGDSHLYAIEPGAGRIVWSVDLADPNAAGLGGQAVRLNGDVWSEPVLGPDGTIYVSTGDPYLRAIDPGGRIKWAKYLGDVDGLDNVDGRRFCLSLGIRRFLRSCRGSDARIFLARPALLCKIGN
jgi:outer membrane protein assembly factor BamB